MGQTGRLIVANKLRTGHRVAVKMNSTEANMQQPLVKDPDVMYPAGRYVSHIFFTSGSTGRPKGMPGAE